MSVRVRRDRDPYTRAVGLVVSRGFGTHVSLSLWWLTLSLHRRDPEIHAQLSALADRAEREARR
jgi:hypothetical protein